MKELPHFLTPAARFLARRSDVIALAVFAIVGAAVLDDYGIAIDEGTQRNNGIASLAYILGDEDALPNGVNRFYGVAFEVPLVVAERLLGLEDSREIHLSRHLLTHLFFLAAGFFAWLLAYRLFASRLVALLAMLMFLLHPRLYAHSFFNTKDLPFLSMFIIALYLTHRAFRRDSVWAFALCGAGVGLLANIRIMGLMLIPAVLGMLALDAFYAVKRGDLGVAKHTIINICAFSTICAATLYAAWPALWRDPLGVAETFGLLSEHPNRAATLFRGADVQWPNLPWDYIPTWILITTPPIALTLAAVGIWSVARLCAADWRDALANSAARFGLLAAACLILPAAAAIALDSNIFNGWRHMYFLYAPLCVLAAFGLRALADIPRPNLRAGALAAVALGLAFAVVSMVRLHPYQSDYFNSLVDKNRVGDRWEMDYWDLSFREALETLLATQPTGHVTVNGPRRLIHNVSIIPENDRRRLRINPYFASFRIANRSGGKAAALWTREIYGVPVVSILDIRAKSEAAHRATYAAARASEPLASGGGFAIYADGGEAGGRLTYVNENCGDGFAPGWFGTSVFPVEQIDLPEWERDAGWEYEPIHFDFHERGAIFDGRCVIVLDLPDYQISHVETWRYTPGETGFGFALIRLGGYDERLRRALAPLADEQPAMRSDFDVYAEDGNLTYVKEGCAEYDTRGRFFLSVFPADPRDLPQAARDAGLEHEPLNFDFHRGAVFDGKCAIIRNLPDYPISRVETGQWTEGAGVLWDGEILFDAYWQPYRNALASLAGEQPAMRSDFDVYAEDGKLTYVKETCAEGDTRGRFFLSVFPADPNDLPQAARDAGLGHESLNFDFSERGAGAMFDGKCVIVRDLPDYPISRIETGQWTDGEGELWRGRVEVGE